jgi:hypothetical protein
MDGFIDLQTFDEQKLHPGQELLAVNCRLSTVNSSTQEGYGFEKKAFPYGA